MLGTAGAGAGAAGTTSAALTSALVQGTIAAGMTTGLGAAAHLGSSAWMANAPAASGAIAAGKTPFSLGGWMANNPVLTSSMLSSALNLAGAYSSSTGTVQSEKVPMPKEHEKVFKDLKGSEEVDRELVQAGSYNNMAAARVQEFTQKLQAQERQAEKALAGAGTYSSVEGATTGGRGVMAGLLHASNEASGGARVQGLRNEMTREGFQKNYAMSGNISNIESQVPNLRAMNDVAGDRAKIIDDQLRGGALFGGLTGIGMGLYDSRVRNT